jgi:MerR family copper efflux transcriptional regulator
MSTTYRIAEVAQRSGFTPAALRYYEDIGLVAPAGRTDAGYRLYDETSLERLRFISRAKQLGCSLDEIADLVTARDGGRCAPVQDRLRTTVEAKINDAHAQIAALTILAANLQRAAATLSTQPVDGPCDDTCGCTTDTALLTVPTSVPLVANAAAAEGPEGAAPIACTLDGADMATRLDEWNALLADEHGLLGGVIARRRLDDGGLRLEFGPGTDVTEIARLAAAEQGCCRFIRFALVIDDRGVALEVHAPPDGEPVLAALFGTAPVALDAPVRKAS